MSSNTIQKETSYLAKILLVFCDILNMDKIREVEMKEKIKEFAKQYLIGFVLGVITAISISVIAATYFPSNDVTYDNTESGLSSTDVQGAIKVVILITI